jgi:uncharacterized membrane protein
MTESTPSLIGSQRSYRLGYVGLWLGGGLAFGLLVAADRPLVGVAAFALAAVLSTLASRRAERPLFDERDEAQRRVAAGWTLAVVGVASAGFFPSMVALHALGIYAWPPWASLLGFFVAGLYLLFGAASVAAGRWG